MGIIRIALVSGLLVSLGIVVLIVSGLIAEVLRDPQRQARQVADIAPPCDCQDCAVATTRRAA